MRLVPGSAARGLPLADTGSPLVLLDVLRCSWSVLRASVLHLLCDLGTVIFQVLGNQLQGQPEFVDPVVRFDCLWRVAAARRHEVWILCFSSAPFPYRPLGQDT